MKPSVDIAGLGRVRLGAQRNLARGERGTQLFEFAMALPVLLAILIGVIYGGITFYDYETLMGAVAAGARTLATTRNIKGGNPCTLAQSMVQASAGALNSTSLTVPTPTFSGSGGSCCPSSTCTGGLVSGDTGTVTATYPCSFKVLLPPFFSVLDLCPKGDLLTSSATVVIE